MTARDAAHAPARRFTTRAATPTTAPMLRFHRIGDWGTADVRAAWTRRSHALPADAREIIERAWRDATAQPGVKLFDGPMCRLESWPAIDASRDGRLRLAFSTTSYKVFFGTNLSHPELADRYGPAVLANPLGVSPALETADGFLLLGKRNHAVAYYPGRIHPFAGSLEATDLDGTDPPIRPLQRASTDPASDPAPPDAGPDVFAAVRRELAEELSLTDADLELIRCTGLVEDLRLRQPELIFRVRTSLSRAQVMAQVDPDEHHAGWAVPATPDGVAQAVREPLLTPIAVASLLLWGRSAFGDAWLAPLRAGVEVPQPKR